MALESAEAFASRLVTHLADTLIRPKMRPAEAKAYAIALIDADRDAVRRALLEEMACALEERRAAGEPLPMAIIKALNEVRLKYARPCAQCLNVNCPCPSCHGAGWFFAIGPDGETAVDITCSCSEPSPERAMSLTPKSRT